MVIVLSLKKFTHTRIIKSSFKVNKTFAPAENLKDKKI